MTDWRAALQPALVEALLRPARLARDAERGLLGSMLGRADWPTLRYPMLAAWTAQWSSSGEQDDRDALPIVHARTPQPLHVTHHHTDVHPVVMRRAPEPSANPPVRAQRPATSPPPTQPTQPTSTSTTPTPPTARITTPDPPRREVPRVVAAFRRNLSESTGDAPPLPHPSAAPSQQSPAPTVNHGPSTAAAAAAGTPAVSASDQATSPIAATAQPLRITATTPRAPVPADSLPHLATATPASPPAPAERPRVTPADLPSQPTRIHTTRTDDAPPTLVHAASIDAVTRSPTTIADAVTRRPAATVADPIPRNPSTTIRDAHTDPAVVLDASTVSPQAARVRARTPTLDDDAPPLTHAASPSPPTSNTPRRVATARPTSLPTARARTRAASPVPSVWADIQTAHPTAAPTPSPDLPHPHTAPRRDVASPSSSQPVPWASPSTSGPTPSAPSELSPTTAPPITTTPAPPAPSKPVDVDRIVDVTLQRLGRELGRARGLRRALR